MPTQILTNVTAAYVGGAHTCAIKTDASVWCWGNNQYGQLGVDVGSQSAVQVPGVAVERRAGIGSEERDEDSKVPPSSPVVSRRPHHAHRRDRP